MDTKPRPDDTADTMATIEPHPCSFPQALLGRCMTCGTVYIRGEQPALLAGFCSDSCEYESRHPYRSIRELDEIREVWKDRM